MERIAIAEGNKDRTLNIKNELGTICPHNKSYLFLVYLKYILIIINFESFSIKQILLSS